MSVGIKSDQVMSGKRSTNEVTQPGRPPEEALDANLRAFSAPVTLEVRETAESNGLDAARYHAEPHSPPRASAVRTHDTAPMSSAPCEIDAAPRVSDSSRKRSSTTVPRGVPMESKISTFAIALAFVLILLGVGAFVIRRGEASGRAPAAHATSPRSITAPSVSTALAASPPPSTTAEPPIDNAPTASNAASAAPPAAARAFTTALVTTMETRVEGIAPTTTASPLPSARTTPGTAPTPASPGAPSRHVPPAPAPTTKYNRFLEEEKK